MKTDTTYVYHCNRCGCVMTVKRDGTWWTIKGVERGEDGIWRRPRDDDGRPLGALWVQGLECGCEDARDWHAVALEVI